jgi:hypothetical protein
MGINVPGYLGDLAGGRAAGAFRQAKVQDDLLRSAGADDAVQLPAMTIEPHALRIRGASPDADFWINTCMAKAFGVDSVRIVAAPETNSGN